MYGQTYSRMLNEKIKNHALPGDIGWPVQRKEAEGKVFIYVYMRSNTMLTP